MRRHIANRPNRWTLSLLVGALAVALVPAGAEAIVCELDTSTDAGSAALWASLFVDVDAERVDYDVLTNGVGAISTAQVKRGGAAFLDLGVVSASGVAAGTVFVPGVDLADLVANATNYSLEVAGSDGAIEVGLTLVDECQADGGLVTLDLEATVIRLANRIKVTVRNNGDDKSRKTVVRFFLSDDDTLSDDDVQFANTKLKRIKAGKKKKAKTASPTTPSGTYFVIADADPDNLNNDPDRTNNVIASAETLEID